MQKPRSKRLRSFVKATSWETISFFLTGLLAYWYTGDLNLSTQFSSICLGIKIVGLYFHERLWHYVDYGKLKDDDKTLPTRCIFGRSLETS